MLTIVIFFFTPDLFIVRSAPQYIILFNFHLVLWPILSNYQSTFCMVQVPSLPTLFTDHKWTARQIVVLQMCCAHSTLFWHSWSLFDIAGSVDFLRMKIKLFLYCANDSRSKAIVFCVDICLNCFSALILISHRLSSVFNVHNTLIVISPSAPVFCTFSQFDGTYCSILSTSIRFELFLVVFVTGLIILFPNRSPVRLSGHSVLWNITYLFVCVCVCACLW